jgi:hypothetical protein
LPAWEPATQQFAGGYARIRDVFVDFANRYGRPGSASAAINVANVAGAIAQTDLLGNVRNQTISDAGAIQIGQIDNMFRNGFE